MTIAGTLKALYKAMTQPTPPSWDIMESYLEDPAGSLGPHFITMFQALANDPAYADRLSTMAVRGVGYNHVFIRATPEGNIDLFALTPRGTVAEWQFQSNGKMAGDGLRDMNHGLACQVHTVIMECFDELSMRPATAGIATRAQSAYVANMQPLLRNSKSANELAYR